MLLAGLFQPRAEWFAGRGWPSQLLLYYACLNAFALVLSAAFLCGLDGKSLATLGLSFRPGWFRQAVLGLCWGGCVISAAVLLLFVTRQADVAIFASGPLPQLIEWALFLALSSAFEELTFRGYALVRAADCMGPVMACLASSALFGFAHYANPQATLLSSLNTTLAGVLLAIARLRSRALWMPIALHFGWNFTLGLVFSLPVSGYAFGAEQPSRPAAGPLWLSGGGYGPEASVALTLALGVAIPLLLRFPRDCQPLPSATKRS